MQERLIIDDGNGPVSRDEVKERFPIASLEDLDELVRDESEDDDRAFSWSDTRPLREILGWRSGKPRPPQPTVSKERGGATLTADNARQFADDVLEVLDLARNLLVDSHGRRAAFEYELEAAAALHKLADAHRQNRRHYRQRAHIAAMLMDLHRIYAAVSKDWPRGVWDRGSRRFHGTDNPDVTGPIMAAQRAALIRFCSKHDIQDVDASVELLERDGAAIHEAEGPANAAVGALEKIIEVGAGTIEKSLSISPFELARTTTRPLVESIQPGASDPYDSALDVVRRLFETLSDKPWPGVSITTSVSGWPRLMGNLLHAVRSACSTSNAPATAGPASATDVSAAERMTVDFARFVLKTIPKRPELLRSLFLEFGEAVTRT